MIVIIEICIFVAVISGLLTYIGMKLAEYMD